MKWLTIEVLVRLCFFFFCTSLYFLLSFLSEKMQSTFNSISLFLSRSSIVYEDWLEPYCNNTHDLLSRTAYHHSENKATWTVLDWRLPVLLYISRSSLNCIHTTQIKGLLLYTRINTDNLKFKHYSSFSTWGQWTALKYEINK